MKAMKTHFFGEKGASLFPVHKFNYTLPVRNYSVEIPFHRAGRIGLNYKKAI